MAVFVDTGAFFALFEKNDGYHLKAKQYYESIFEKAILVTSLPVAVETWQFLETRQGYLYANRFWRAILDGFAEILPIDGSIFHHALEIETKYSDAKFGLVDCTTFALCERNHLDTVFTVDRKHFGIYRPQFTKLLKLVPEI